jgi:hypothetical protein
MRTVKKKTVGQLFITICAVMLLAGLVSGSLPTLNLVTKYENWKITIETYPPSTGAPYEKRVSWKCDENWQVIIVGDHGYGVFIKAGETAEEAAEWLKARLGIACRNVEYLFEDSQFYYYKVTRWYNTPTYPSEPTTEPEPTTKPNEPSEPDPEAEEFIITIEDQSTGQTETIIVQDPDIVDPSSDVSTAVRYYRSEIFLWTAVALGVIGVIVIFFAVKK